MIIRQVTPGLSDWARLAVGVLDACEGAPTSEKHSFQAFKNLIDNGFALWFVCIDGEEILADFIIKTTQEDDVRVFNLPIMFGRDIARWQYLAREFFTDMAKANHCQMIRAVSYKEGISRLYRRIDLFEGYRRVYVFEKEV